MEYAMEQILKREHDWFFLKKRSYRNDTQTLLTEFDFSVSPDLSVILHFLPSWFNLPVPNLQPMPGHSHDYFELIYAASGHFYNSVESPDFCLDTTKLVLIPPGYYHAPYIRYDSDRIINLMIRPQLMERSLYFFGNNSLDLSPFFYEYIYGLPTSMKYLLLEATDDIRQAIARIVRLYSHFDCSLAPRLLAAFAELLALMAESYHIYGTEHTPAASINQEIINYIRLHYLTVTRSELCETFHYSPSHLSHIIKQETGKTFKELTTEYKLKSAKNFLTTTTLPIDKISRILHFEDPYYLSRLFKQAYGITPSQFREQNISFPL